MRNLPAFLGKIAFILISLGLTVSAFTSPSLSNQHIVLLVSALLALLLYAVRKALSLALASMILSTILLASTPKLLYTLIVVSGYALLVATIEPVSVKGRVAREKSKGYSFLASRDAEYLAVTLLAPMASTLLVCVPIIPVLIPNTLTSLKDFLSLANSNIVSRIAIMFLGVMAAPLLSRTISSLGLGIIAPHTLRPLKTGFYRFVNFLTAFLVIEVYSYIIYAAFLEASAPWLVNPFYTVTAGIILALVISIQARRAKRVAYAAILSLIVIILYVLVEAGAGTAMQLLIGEPVRTTLDDKLHSIAETHTQYYRVVVLALEYMGLLP